MKIGVVGYIRECFDPSQARDFLKKILYQILEGLNNHEIELVSGYTNAGVPKISYQLAQELGLVTVGFTAKAALNSSFELFPVQKSIIVGEQFGDESKAFIEYIDVLIRIGGGVQSHSEVAMFKEKHTISNLDNLLFEADLNILS